MQIISNKADHIFFISFHFSIHNLTNSIPFGKQHLHIPHIFFIETMNVKKREKN